LLIHETYLLGEKIEWHGCINDVIKIAEDNDIKCLALTHINRDLRKKGFEVKSDKVKIIVPKPFDEIEI
jgi:ribonuclease BN (tRNA processing enzyme)